ncbi:MAG: glycosyltransferase family 2 protein [Balneolaceae bacterium]|nr:MAG: glycosyltransferase family 2 protein [Balneolaceae bacterium]
MHSENSSSTVQPLPLVSVVIPVYNGARYLGDALDSVFNQSYPLMEVIVVDDGSTDQSSMIAKGYPGVRYLYQSNQGVSAARNSAINIAKGEFIAFLDADDIWKPEKLTRQMNFMLKNPEILITGTNAVNFLEPDTLLPDWLAKRSGWKEVKHIIPSTMVVHSSVFSGIGGFSTEYRSNEDTEWLWRAKKAEITMNILDEILTLRRYHGANLSWKTAFTGNSGLFRIIRKSLKKPTDPST